MPDKKYLTNNLTIRIPHLDDLQALVDLENQCFPEARYDVVRLTKDKYRHYIEKNANDLVIAVDKTGKIIGCLIMEFFIAGACASIESVAAAVHARHLGVGRALMIEAENKARGKGCTSIRLEVHEENHHAISLYKKMGYVPCGIIPDTYSDGSAMRAFSKNIAKPGNEFNGLK